MTKSQLKQTKTLFILSIRKGRKETHRTNDNGTEVGRYGHRFLRLQLLVYQDALILFSMIVAIQI